MHEGYSQLMAAVERAGYFVSLQPTRPDSARVVFASRREVTESGFRLGGNSFWVAKRGDKWFIATWAPRIFEVLEPGNITELCLRLLSRSPARPYSDFDALVKSEFKLAEIADKDFPD